MGGADGDYLGILDEGTHKGVADSLALEGSEASEEFGNVLVVAVVFFAVRVEVPPLLPALVGVTDTVDHSADNHAGGVGVADGVGGAEGVGRQPRVAGGVGVGGVPEGGGGVEEAGVEVVVVEAAEAAPLLAAVEVGLPLRLAVGLAVGIVLHVLLHLPGVVDGHADRAQAVAQQVRPHRRDHLLNRQNDRAPRRRSRQGRRRQRAPHPGGSQPPTQNDATALQTHNSSGALRPLLPQIYNHYPGRATIYVLKHIKSQKSLNKTQKRAAC